VEDCFPELDEFWVCDVTTGDLIYEPEEAGGGIRAFNSSELVATGMWHDQGRQLSEPPAKRLRPYGLAASEPSFQPPAKRLRPEAPSKLVQPEAMALLEENELHTALASAPLERLDESEEKAEVLVTEEGVIALASQDDWEEELETLTGVPVQLVLPTQAGDPGRVILGPGLPAEVRAAKATAQARVDALLRLPAGSSSCAADDYCADVEKEEDSWAQCDMNAEAAYVSPSGSRAEELQGQAIDVPVAESRPSSKGLALKNLKAKACPQPKLSKQVSPDEACKEGGEAAIRKWEEDKENAVDSKEGTDQQIGKDEEKEATEGKEGKEQEEDEQQTGDGMEEEKKRTEEKEDKEAGKGDGGEKARSDGHGNDKSEEAAAPGQLEAPPTEEPLPPKTALQKDDEVVVNEEFLTDSNVRVHLRQGQRGVVVHVDESGDAYIRFEDHPQEQWVFVESHGNLSKAEPRPLATSTPLQGTAKGGEQAQAKAKTLKEWLEDQDQFKDLPALPEDWIRVRSKTSGAIYYVNYKSGATQLTQPELPLPPGWTVETSKSSGRRYFWNATRGESRFDRPKA